MAKIDILIFTQRQENYDILYNSSISNKYIFTLTNIITMLNMIQNLSVSN